MRQNLSDRIASCPEERRLLEQERLILDATELICEAMESAGVSRSDLAKKLGKSKGYVSQLLGGSRNMTLRTLADILTALNQRLELRAQSVRSSGSDRMGLPPLTLPVMRVMGAEKQRVEEAKQEPK